MAIEMAYAKGIFDFLNKTIEPIIMNNRWNFQIIKRTEQCKVGMQLVWLKLKPFDKAADRGCLHVNVATREMESPIVTKLLILFFILYHSSY